MLVPDLSRPTPEGWKAELTYRLDDGWLLTCPKAVTHPATNPMHDRESNSHVEELEAVDHKSDALTITLQYTASSNLGMIIIRPVSDVSLVYIDVLHILSYLEDIRGQQ